MRPQAGDNASLSLWLAQPYKGHRDGEPQGADISPPRIHPLVSVYTRIYHKAGHVLDTT